LNTNIIFVYLLGYSTIVLL